MQERNDHSLMGHADVSYHQSLLGTSSRLAWTYVGVLCASYAVCLTVLHSLAPVDVGMWQAFLQQVPLDVFKWQLAAFGGVLLLNIINLVFCGNPVQYNCNVLLVLIHSVAFATDWLIEAQSTSLVLGHNGRFFVPLRYVQWVHTTPTMILLMSMMSDLPSWRVSAAVGGDLVMVLAGLGASWTSGPLQVVLLLVSFAGFGVVMHAIVDMFAGAMAESGTDGTSRQLLGRMLALTLVVWSLFPLVWLLGQAGVVSLTVEQVLWGAADYGAKVVFSSHLWQKNLSTVQQRREAAQELMGALDRGLLLERVRGLVASKERLVYALSHELRSPINGMLALVQELLHNKTQSAASRTRMLHMIRSSATCLLNTIDTTLSHNGSAGAGDAAGQHSRRTHKVYLWRVCESVLRLTQPMVKDNVRLINCISRDMPPVKGDSTRLMQVLLNLVCTCLKFTHAGDVRVSASQTHSAASVVVADTGQGIPAEQLAHALDPFQQGGDGADVWDVCRSGLGLYLVQQALSSMGSSINASSELGRGSSFCFELPLADSECESESELETDMFSEAGSLRASLELDYDGSTSRAAPRGLYGSDTSQIGGSKHPSTDLLSTPAATPGGPRPGSYASSSTAHLGLTSVADSSTAASSITYCSGEQDGAAAANGSHAAAAEGAANSQQPGPSAGGRAPALQEQATGSPNAAAVAAAAASAGHLPMKPCHRSVRNGVIQVLSVDDDPVNQLVASTALRSHKWEVIKCMSGTEALEYLERSCSVLPDLVLLDVMMPSMSGYEVAARLRQSYPSSLLPIIMVSAKTEEADIVQGLRCGADDYITKPFKRAELAARIRAHIRARDAFAEQQAAEQAWLMQHNLLPPNVQRKLRAGETVIAESHPAATVLWAEVVGGLAGTPSSAAAAASHTRQQHHSQQQLAGLSSSGAQGQLQQPGAAEGPSVSSCASCERVLSPAEAVVTLNSLYTTWEELCGQRDVLGVDFSGSTFVAVSGHDDNPGHLGHMLATAEAMLGVAAAMAAQHEGCSLAVRLGLHTGPITTGLVGSKAVKLVLMGDTVEVARQLASSGCPLGLHISAPVYASLGGSSGLAAAAMPWTLQVLPGSSSRQHTYLLPSAACAAAAAAWGVSLEQHPRDAASSSSAGRLGRIDSSSCTYLSTAAAAAAQLQQQAAAASTVVQQAAAIPGVANSTGGMPAAVHEVGSGRVARVLRPSAAGEAAAAAVAAATATAAGADASCTATAAENPNDLVGVDTAEEADTVPAEQQQQHATEYVPVSGASRISSKSAAGVVVCTALPAPAPCGSVGFLGTAGRHSSGTMSGPLVRADAAAATGSAPSAALAVPAVIAPAVGLGERSASSTVQNWLLASSQQALSTSSSNVPQPATGGDSTSKAQPADAAALAAITAAVAAGSARGTAGTTHSSVPRASSLVGVVNAAHPVGSSSEAPHCLPAAAASASELAVQQLATLEQQQEQQQLQRLSAALLQQLGEERQQLQHKLLAASEQGAAAAAELGCLRQQLEQSRCKAASQTTLVESLRQQLGSALVRAHLADCWKALATMKMQLGSALGTNGQQPQLSAAAIQGALLQQALLAAQQLTVPGLPQQVLQLAPTVLPAGAAAPGSPSTQGNAAQQLPASPSGAAAAATSAAGAVSFLAAGSTPALIPHIAELEAVAASLQLQQLLPMYVPHLGALQQQQQQQQQLQQQVLVAGLLHLQQQQQHASSGVGLQQQLQQAPVLMLQQGTGSNNTAPAAVSRASSAGLPQPVAAASADCSNSLAHGRDSCSGGA